MLVHFFITTSASKFIDQRLIAIWFLNRIRFMYGPLMAMWPEKIQLTGGTLLTKIYHGDKGHDFMKILDVEKISNFEQMGNQMVDCSYF